MPDGLSSVFVTRPGYAALDYTDPLRASAERHATAEEVAALRDDIMSLANAVSILAAHALYERLRPADVEPVKTAELKEAIERAEAISAKHGREL